MISWVYALMVALSAARSSKATLFITGIFNGIFTDILDLQRVFNTCSSGAGFWWFGHLLFSPSWFVTRGRWRLALHGTEINRETCIFTADFLAKLEHKTSFSYAASHTVLTRSKERRCQQWIISSLSLKWSMHTRIHRHSMRPKNWIKIDSSLILSWYLAETPLKSFHFL